MVTSHGRSGYRKGCKCSVCRGAHAAYMQSWRSRRRDEQARAALADVEPLVVERPVADPVQVPAGLDLQAPPGPLESAFLEDLSTPSARTAFERTLIAMGRLNARVLDQTAALDRLDLVSPLELRTLEVLQRLAIVGFAGLEDDEASEGDVSDLAAVMLAEMEREGLGAAGGRQA